MSAPRLGRRVRALLVSVYPAAWQARYGDEYLALLEQLPLSPRVVADHLRGALGAYLDTSGETPSTQAAAGRLRAGELTVLFAWLALVVGGLAFQRMIDDAALVAVDTAHEASRLATVLVAAGAATSLLAVLVGTLPALLAVVRTAIAERRPRLAVLLAVPPGLLAAWLALTLWLAGPGPGPAADRPAVAVFAVWAGSFIAALVAGSGAVSLAAARARVPLACYRFAVMPAYAVTASMALIWTGVLAWGVALASQAPDLFWGDQGLLASSTALSWLGVVALMSAAVAVAVRSAAQVRGQAVRS